MLDTSPEAERIQREMIMSRTGAERLLMAVRMNEAARTMILASLPDDLGFAELRIALYERFCGEPAPLGFIARLKKMELEQSE